MARWKVNRQLLPVKAHYFFFFAALGPVLPQLNVYGRQLGVSPEVMGLVTAVLPLLWAVAKPCFGYLVDYFTNQRKLIFMLLIALMSSSYCGLWFLPEPPHLQLTPATVLETVYRLNSTVYLISTTNASITKDVLRMGNNLSMLDNGTIPSGIGARKSDIVTLISDSGNESFDKLYGDHSANETDEGNASALKDSTFILNNPNITEPLNVRVNNHLTKAKILGTIEQNGTDVFKKYNCHWNCKQTAHFYIWLAASGDVINAMYVDRYINNGTCAEFNMELVNYDGDLTCKPFINCNLLCMNEDPFPIDSEISDIDILKEVFDAESDIKAIFDDEKSVNATDRSKVANEVAGAVLMGNNDESDIFKETKINSLSNCTKGLLENDTNNARTVCSETHIGKSIYGTVTFWGFVILMCIGTVAFNVANCIGDAVCFDVLGPERMSRYGSQRAWGTAGYGATAFLGGWLVTLASDGAWSNFTPAFVLAAAFTLLDLISCRHLHLPQLTSAEEASGALWDVLRCPRVLVFLCFAVVAGMFDSFIIYYMFWYLEELAETSQTQDIKLLEGIIVLGQSLVGELLFFFLSGRILKRFGHGITMTFCLLCYSLRLAFVSLVTNPWHLVPIEAIMQGPTYALTYATIVGYAAGVAPEGHSATMQGIVAGVDDGLGFALGSLVGGQLYGCVGGASAFRVMALLAALAAALHALLHRTVLRAKQKAQNLESDAASPEEAERMLASSKRQTNGNTVYCETVVPLGGGR